MVRGKACSCASVKCCLCLDKSCTTEAVKSEKDKRLIKIKKCSKI